MKCFIIAAVLLLAASSPSYAQGVTFPGSMWSVNGTASTAEPGNYTTRTHIEQAVEQNNLSVVAESTLVGDTKANDWNRSALLGVLARYTFHVNGGVVRLNFGYETEKRFVSARIASGVVYSVDCWFGWTLKTK